MKVVTFLIKVIKMLSKFMNIALSSTIVAILGVAQNVNSSGLKQETGDNLFIPYHTKQQLMADRLRIFIY